MRNDPAFEKLLAFLCELERKGIDYSLAHNREDAIMVSAAAPGERWEMEFCDDGAVELEIFRSDGQIYGEDALNVFLAKYSDDVPARVEPPQSDIGSLSSKMD